MNINLLENIELVHGAAEVTAIEDGFLLSRMTSELTEFYSYSEAAEIRAACGAGVRISFESNTSFLAVRLDLGRQSRPIYTTDVVIDGIDTFTFGPEEEGCESYAFNAELPGIGEHRIEIYLPNMCEAVVAELVIEDGATLTPVKYKSGGVIFLGDSITQGMTTSSPAQAYAARLGMAMERDWVNVAVGGAVMKQEVGTMALKYDWKIAFVAFGTNDCAQDRSLAEFESDTRGLLTALTSRKTAKVYVITPIPWLTATKDNLDDFREVLTNVAAEFDRVMVLDGRELVPAEDLYFADGCHPNDLGMAAMAVNIFEKIN